MEDANRMRIILNAHELFNTRGYKSVTISDLAQRLGMSKKTIYQYFSGKEEIATAVIENAFARISTTITNSESRQSNPLQLLQITLKQVMHHISSLGSLFLEDIQKLLPDLWKRIEQFRAEKIKFVERLLQRAQDNGLVKDIDPRMVMAIFAEAVHAVTKPEFVSRHGFHTVDTLNTMIQIFCTGVVEPKIFEPNAKL